MHTPKGCALMGWVPYPAHMGPRFAGPIIGAHRAPQKKKIIEVHVPASTQPSIGRDNLGQKLWAALVNVRLCAPSPNPLPTEMWLARYTSS